MTPTSYQLHLLNHTLGLRVDQREPYRNHFVAGHGHRDMPDLEALVAGGLMERRRSPAFLGKGDIVFSVTDAGKACAIERLPPEPKRTKYGEYLHADCFDSFADYLGINKPKYETRGDWGKYEYRMFRRDLSVSWAVYPDVAGEWCKTKKEAKASYKAALTSRRAAAEIGKAMA